MVLVWFGVTGSEVMFLCLHTFLLYSNGNGCSLVEHQKPPTFCSINFSQQWYQMGIEGACIVEAQKHSLGEGFLFREHTFCYGQR